MLSPSRGRCLCRLTSQVRGAHLRQTGRGRRSHTPATSALRNSQPLAAVYGHQLGKAGQQHALPGCSQSSPARQPPQGTQDLGGQADASLTARSSLARQPALPAARSSKPFPGRRWHPVRVCHQNVLPCSEQPRRSLHLGPTSPCSPQILQTLVPGEKFQKLSGGWGSHCPSPWGHSEAE